MTIKKYYEDEFLSSCTSKITAILQNEPSGIVCESTVAFAEGGGQEGDTGVIIRENGEEIPFTYTSKFGGRRLIGGEFDGICVESDVLHHLEASDLTKFQVGESVKIKINITRRAKLSSYHGALHLALMGLEHSRPLIADKIYGCKISEDGARLDFHVDDKFSAQELECAMKIANDYIKRELKIETFPSQSEPEAFFWECDGRKMACGGTHFKNTKFFGEIIVKRKNIGKGADRMKIEIMNMPNLTGFYHDENSQNSGEICEKSSENGEKFYSQNSKNNKQIRTKSNDFVKNSDEICKINGEKFSQICLQSDEIFPKVGKEICAKNSKQICFKNSTINAKFYKTSSNQNIKICENSEKNCTKANDKICDKSNKICSKNSDNFYPQNRKQIGIKICEKFIKTDEIYSQNKAKFYTRNSKENR